MESYDKLYDECVIDGILSPVHLDFFWIFKHFIEHNGVEPSKEIKMEIDRDNNTSNKIFLFRT
jgi:hypothetical protein